VKISFTVIEILTFNKWSSEVYHSQKRAFLVTFHGADFDPFPFLGGCWTKRRPGL